MEPPVTRVLIVDDNPGDARLVEYALTHEPDVVFRCTRAPRVAAAVEALGRREADVVLLDLNLPDSQGTDGIHRIRSVAPEVPVLVLTGSQDPDKVKAAIAAGAQDYLIKGIFPKGYLAAAIRLAQWIHRLESGLAQNHPPDAASLEEFSRVGTGVAVLVPSGADVVNPAFTTLTGFAGASQLELPTWLAALVGGWPGGPSSDAARGGAAPEDFGELTLERPGGEPVRLEYAVRRYPHGDVPRVLVHLREVSLQRRAPGHTPRAGRLANARSPPTPAAPTAASGDALLDAGTWQNLRELAGADATFLPALVAAFLSEGRRMAGGLQSAVDDADGAAVARLAHTLKSTCAQVGALALSQECARLEVQAETGNLPETRALVLRIARDFAGVADALRAKYPPPP
jgi:DNA-binding NarL/FixJ family response regulator/HPt (histidine-containing phosphotransfer) domain-containing protein